MLPLHPPPLIFDGQAISSVCTRYSPIRAKIPHPVRSLRPGIPPPPLPFPSHPIAPYNHPHYPLQHQVDTERDALSFRFGRAHPRLICSLRSPTTTCISTPSHRLPPHAPPRIFNSQAILSVNTRHLALRVKIPRPHPIC